jgi:hypothetical protein
MRTDKAENPHVLPTQVHYDLLVCIFASIAEQGLLTEEVMALGGFQELVERGMV